MSYKYMMLNNINDLIEARRQGLGLRQANSAHRPELEWFVSRTDARVHHAKSRDFRTAIDPEYPHRVQVYRRVQLKSGVHLKYQQDRPIKIWGNSSIAARQG